MSPAIPDHVRVHIRAQSGDRCGYCRSHQRYVLGLLEIEHIIPTARGGSDTEVLGRTATGRATVTALQLNNAIARMVRSAWVSAGWHPPVE